MKKLLSIVFFAVCGIAYAQSSGYKCVGGVYYSYNDFLNGKITDLGVMTGYNEKLVNFSKPDTTMTIGPQNYKFNFKEGKIWGFRSTDGSTYRYNPNDGKVYNLIKTGAMYLWGDDNVSVGRDEKGIVNWVQMRYAQSLTQGFAKHLLITMEGSGTFYNCTNKNVRELFKSEPDIFADIEANPVRENSAEESMKNLMKWIDVYNQKHK